MPRLVKSKPHELNGHVSAPTGDPPALTEALRLHAAGWWVVPVIGKKGLNLRWQADRLTETDLREWLAGGRPNIAIVLNQSECVDLECDSEEAETALQKVFGGRIPRTPTWQARRGKHRLFRRPSGDGFPRKAKYETVDGVEVRGMQTTKVDKKGEPLGSLSVVPPSVHPEDGTQYAWVDGLRLGDVEPADLPPTVVEWLRTAAETKPSETSGRGEARAVGSTPAKGQRNSKAERRAVAYLAAIPPAVSGQGGHGQTFAAARAIVYGFGLGAEAGYRVLARNYNPQCQPPWSEAELRHKCEDADAKEDDERPRGYMLLRAPIAQPSGRTDSANARRLLARFGNLFRWVGPWDKFLIWDRRRWAVDQVLRIEGLTKEAAADLWTAVGREAAAGKLSKEELAPLVAFARTSNNANGVRNAVAMAKSEPGVAIGIDELDTGPWLLNVRNGTLDLRTGRLREHRRDDWITKLAPVTYDPTASCPHWDEFLRTIFAGNDDLIGYVRRLVGYALTGDTGEHILPFLWGAGANGKSTLLETLLKLWGVDYGMKAGHDLLTSKRGESHPTERADLFGKRLVACVETEQGRKLADALVKEMTGGDRIRARRMREDFWEFAPTHHVWLAGNYKPAVGGTDHGIWRRIKLIPFVVTIPEAEQDRQLKDKLAEELPGILNWAIAGCLDWQRDGMREPAIVSAATSGYRQENDEVGEFVDGWCVTDPKAVVGATELYEAFGEATDSDISQRTFAERLHMMGFVNRQPNGKPLRLPDGKAAWKGLRLRGPVQQPPRGML